ncbi:plasmid mobilization relaxosome protein MobC [Staphylococcus saprophyticus]
MNQLTRRANASTGAIDSEELQAIKKELHAIWQQFS